MLSLKGFFSSLLGNQYVLDKSEIKKFGPNKDGLYQYTKFELFKNKKESSARAYRTVLVKEGVSSEDAMNSSISFKFDLSEDKGLLNENRNHNIEITHYTCEYNKRNKTHSGGKIWKFEDGSNIEEIITYTRRS